MPLFPASARWATLALASLLILGPALRAQTPLDDPLDEHSAKRVDRLEKAMKELRAIVIQGRETGAPVQVQPADTPLQINSLQDKVSTLEQSLSRMNGQLEVVRHDLDLANRQADNLRAENADLKTRLAVLEQKAAAPPPPPPVTSPVAALALAKDALAAGQNAQAEAAFRDIIDRFADNPVAPEARYGLAKTLMAKNAWAEAATFEADALRGWPKTRWAPDALLDLAKALVRLDRSQDACGALGELAKRYPTAPPQVKSGATETRARAGCV
jgi:TolA-binding protein